MGMGRDILRRKILVSDNKKVNVKPISFLLIIFFAVAASGPGLLHAQSDIERPRTVLELNQPRDPRSLLKPSVLEQPLFLRYYDHYTSPSGIAYMNAVMERASLYLPYIKEEIKKRKLPPELAYLPVIESDFVITAKSKSGAVGLWQFMLNSISPFNIKVNDTIDERRDFQKSTKGALQKLEDNYKALGNWELALAAYNCGLGAMTRTIKKTKLRNYWELSRRKDIRQETVDYVPKFLAVAYILSDPLRFGIDCSRESPKWTTIPLKKQVSLDTLAAESGADGELLKLLNAELLQGVTPANRNFQLKVPVSHLEPIKAVLGKENLALDSYHRHTVSHGDTLWSVSRRYGASVDMLEQHNPGISDRYLKIGETIVIPASKGATPPPPRPASNTRFDGNYEVKKGDTLWSLAAGYGIAPQDLAQANNMELNQILREGIILKIPIH